MARTKPSTPSTPSPPRSQNLSLPIRSKSISPPPGAERRTKWQGSQNPFISNDLAAKTSGTSSDDDLERQIQSTLREQLSKDGFRVASKRRDSGSSSEADTPSVEDVGADVSNIEITESDEESLATKAAKYGWPSVARIDAVLAQVPKVPYSTLDQISESWPHRIQYLSRFKDLPSGLVEFINNIDTIHLQDWTHLAVKTGEMYRGVVTRVYTQQALIEELIKVSEGYARAVFYAAENEIELDFSQIDGDIGEIVRDLVKLGAAAEAEGQQVVDYKEWEHNEIKSLFETDFSYETEV